MTPSSLPGSGATERYPSYGPSWQDYVFLHRGYGGCQMFPPQQLTRHGRSSSGTHRVPPAPPGNYPVIRLTSSPSTLPVHHPSASGRLPISLPTKRSQLVVEPQRTIAAWISNWPPLPAICSDIGNADYGSDDSSDLGCAEGTAPMSLKQTAFPLKQFCKKDWAAQL
jgi:hypothetical protein